MRTLTALAIAVVLVGAGVGVLMPVRDSHKDAAAKPNHEIGLQVIQDGAGQTDQNLKLLIAVQVGARQGEGGSNGNDRDDRGRSGDAGRGGN